MNYKMICIDMDGTLLNSKKNLSEVNKIALKKAYDDGVHIIICTGRNSRSALYFANEIGIESAVIANNGALVIDESGEVLIFKEALEKVQCEKILEISNKYKTIPNFHALGKIYLNSKFRMFINNMFFNRNVPEKYKIKNIYLKKSSEWTSLFDAKTEVFGKCIMLDPSKSKLKQIENELKNTNMFELTYSGKYCLEINSKDVSKGRAVKMLGEHYGIKKEEIICIGDNGNDISMLKYAGLGVAMKNGTQAVKDISDYITDTNDNNGVAKVVEKFIFNKE
ncbi:Cof-type HAD-IIB family hydrolase [uncultured Clostridium sp.]|uniref:Cof-type HAD-IIB family hydrolase n=1 Tax=uncultured Clostridium sp. TaxID=59620 RepID=UPI002602A389|nr:Cof-type HAD-IIB family hydrolase [uncultured Clostridium sp.]